MSSRLSSLLVQDGLVTAKRVADAFQRQVIYGGTLDSNLLELKAVDEDDLIHYLGRADGMPTQPTGISGAGMPLPEILEVFTKEVAERFHAVPTKLLPGGVLRVLVPDGVDLSEFDELALCVQQRIEPWITLEFRFVEAMDKIYGTGTPSRYARLLSRSVQAHQGREWPPARPIDPLPRFGSLASLRLVPEPPPPPAVPPPAKDEPTTLMVAPALSGENTASLQIAAAVAASERTAVLEGPAGGKPGDTTTSLAIPVLAEATATMAVPPHESTASLPIPGLPTAAPTVASALPGAAVEATASLSVPAESTAAMAVPAAVESTTAMAVPAAAESTAAMVIPVESTAAMAVPAATESVAPSRSSEPSARPQAPAAQSIVPAVPVSEREAAPAPSSPPAERDAASAVPEFLPTIIVDPNTLNLDHSGPMKLAPMVTAAKTADAEAAPPVAGLDDLSIADWMSAADWLSLANKVDALGSARSPAPGGRLAAPEAAPEAAPAAENQPAPLKPEAQPALAAASTQERPAAEPTAPVITVPAVEKSVQLAAPPVTAPPITAPVAAKPPQVPVAGRPATPPPVAAEPAGRKKGKKGKEAKQLQARQAAANQAAARPQQAAAPQPVPGTQPAASAARPAQPVQAAASVGPSPAASKLVVADRAAQPEQPLVTQPAASAARQPTAPEAGLSAPVAPVAAQPTESPVRPTVAAPEASKSGPASAVSAKLPVTPPTPSAAQQAAAPEAGKSGPASPVSAKLPAAQPSAAASEAGKSGPVSPVSAKLSAAQPSAAASEAGKSGPPSAVSVKLPAAQPSTAASEAGKSGPVSSVSAKLPAAQPSAAASEAGKSGPVSPVSAKLPAAQPSAAASEAGKSGPVSPVSAKLPVSQPTPSAAKPAAAPEAGKSGPVSPVSAKLPVSQPTPSAAKPAAAPEAGKSGLGSAISAKLPAAQPAAAAEAGKRGPAAAAAAKAADLAEPPPASAPPPSQPRLPEPGPKPEVAVAQPAAATQRKPTPAPEPIPEPVNSGRLGEPILGKKDLAKIPAATGVPAAPAAASVAVQAAGLIAVQAAAPAAAQATTSVAAATAASVAAESAGSLVPRLGPPPRVATALDAGGSSPISVEAARELTGAVEEDRDAIFEALCRGARSRCAFAAVFTLHGEVAFGRVALLDEWLDRAQLGRIAVQLDRASPFRTVAKERTSFLGTIGIEAAASDPLRALHRSVPIAAAVLPVLVRGRAVALLYLDDDGHELPSTVLEELKPLLADVGQAFGRIAQKSKAGGLGAEPELGTVGEEMAPAGTSAWRAPSVKSPRPGAQPVAPGESQTTPLPPSVPAAASPVPQPVSEQPTVPLRVAPPTAAPAPSKTAPAAPGPSAAEPSRPAVPEHIHTQPTVPVATAVKVAAQPAAAPPAAAPAKAAPATGKNDKRAGKSGEAAAAPVPVARDAGGKPTLAELIERAGNLDENAIDQLLAGGSEAAKAVVAALPGPLRSRERQALGDPVGGPVYSRGPLLALALRMGPLAIEPMLARLADPSTPSEARYYLTLCFAEAPVATAIAPLGSCLYDSDDAVRMAAVSALRSFPPSSELSSLISKLRDTMDGADAKRARFAVEALGELRVATAVPQLINLLDHEDPALVDAVGRALQTITKQDFGRSRSRWTSWWRRRQDEPRLQWLLEGLTHPSAMLRSAAQDELTGLSGDVVGYRFDQPRRDREQARKRWAQWWQRRGYPVL